MADRDDAGAALPRACSPGARCRARARAGRAPHWRPRAAATAAAGRPPWACSRPCAARARRRCASGCPCACRRLARATRRGGAARSSCALRRRCDAARRARGAARRGRGGARRGARMRMCMRTRACRRPQEGARSEARIARGFVRVQATCVAAARARRAPERGLRLRVGSAPPDATLAPATAMPASRARPRAARVPSTLA